MARGFTPSLPRAIPSLLPETVPNAEIPGIHHGDQLRGSGKRYCREDRPAEGRGQNGAATGGSSAVRVVGSVVMTEIGGTRLQPSPRSGEAPGDWPGGLVGRLGMVTAMTTIKGNYAREAKFVDD